MHSPKICIGDLCRLVVELNYFQLSQLPKFQKDIKKKNFVQIANSLDTYYSSLQELFQKKREKSDRRQYKKQLIKQLEEDGIVYDDDYIKYELKNYKPSCKLSHDSNPEIADLINKGLKIEFIKNVKYSVDQLKQTVTSKLTSITKQTFKFAEDLAKEREQVLTNEHKLYLENKKLGLKSVIDFKATKLATQSKFIKVQEIAISELEDTKQKTIFSEKLYIAEENNKEKSLGINYAKERLAKLNYYIARCKELISRGKSIGLGEDDNFNDNGIDLTELPTPYGKHLFVNIKDCKNHIVKWEAEKKHLNHLVHDL
jgi:hypothetical protein